MTGVDGTTSAQAWSGQLTYLRGVLNAQGHFYIHQDARLAMQIDITWGTYETNEFVVPSFRGLNPIISTKNRIETMK